MRVLACVSFLSVLLLALDPDVHKGMVAIVSEKGYPIEEEFVTTDDGYILGMFHIPHGRDNGDTVSAPRPVVFLQHGLLDSSFTFVNNPADESLAFLLADAGFDVWLGNNRGNVFSKAHKTLPVASDAFWDFSWDEMARYDMPNQIDFVLKQTGQKHLAYIGHSEGTTQAFAALSMNETLRTKLSAFIGLAPVAYVAHQRSFLFRLMADLDIAELVKFFGFREFLPDNTILQKLDPYLCNTIPHACDDILFALCGPTHHTNESRLQVYISETPAGTSVKNMVHWAQSVKTDKFQMYDYGCGVFSCENQDHYHQRTPPEYNLSNVAVPMAMYTGTEDYLADLEDFSRTSSELPRDSLVQNRTVYGYAHLDFVWAFDANKLLYADVIDYLKSL